MNIHAYIHVILPTMHHQNLHSSLQHLFSTYAGTLQNNNYTHKHKNKHGGR